MTTITEDKAAPDQLALIQALVNTQYGQSRRTHTELTNHEQMRVWLVAHNLFAEEIPVTEGDFQRFLQVREVLRALLHTNNDGEASPTQIEVLNNLASNAPLTVHFQLDGRPALEPGIAGIDGVIAELLGIIFTSMIDGSWDRLKVCRNERCQKAFYDTSKNRSGAWCSMTGCGSRSKANAYRQRHNEQSDGGNTNG